MVVRKAWMRRVILPAGALLVSLNDCACTTVSRSRLDDCRLRLQAVQAENEQLRDVALNVRNQNRDMALRAVEDSRRLRAQDEAIQRLEKSVLAYQDERERMASALDDLRTQVKTAASEAPVTAALDEPRGRVDSAVQLTGFEPARSSLPTVDRKNDRIRVPINGLFEPDSVVLSPAGERTFADLCRVLSGWLDEDSSNSGIQVSTLSPATGTVSGQAEAKAKAAWLSRARLTQIQKLLVERTGLPASRVTTLAADSKNAGQVGSNTGGDESLFVIDVLGRQK